MNRPHLRVGGLAAGVASASLALIGTSLSPVQAAVYSASEVELDQNAWLQNGTCTADGDLPVSPPDLPLPENGTPVTSTLNAVASYVADADATDGNTVRTKLTGTARLTTSGGAPSAVSLSFSGSSSATTTKATSACLVAARASLEAAFEFTSTTPMWVTMSFSKKGPAYAEAYLYEDDAPPYQDSYGFGWDSNSVTTLFLPAGTYRGYVEGESYLSSDKTVAARALSGKAAITFARVGSASARPSGKAKPYVTLPAARTCASHDVKTAITGSAKRAKRIDSVVYKVNGRKVATLKGKKVKKGKATSLRIADNRAAQVEAVVTLNSGKRLSTKASYRACSA